MYKLYLRWANEQGAMLGIKMDADILKIPPLYCITCMRRAVATDKCRLTNHVCREVTDSTQYTFKEYLTTLQI